MNFSSTSVKLLAASLILASTTGLAFAKNYKGEANYKGEMAVPCPAPVTLKDGFYLGGQVGYDSYRVRHNVDVTAPAVLTANPVLNATGWVGGLFLGYGQYFNDLYYLAGELFGNYSGADTSYSINTPAVNYTAKYEARGTWGLAVLPGIKLNDTSLAYVRLGYNWTSLKGKASAVNVDTAGTVSASNTKTRSGFNWGFGLETLVYENWSVRTEYNHTYLNSHSNSFGNAVATGTSKFSPSDNQVMVGLLYHFA